MAAFRIVKHSSGLVWRSQEAGWQRSSEEGSQFRADSAAFHVLQNRMRELEEENHTMQARLACVGSERDDLLQRVMQLEDAAAATDLRSSRLQMLKVTKASEISA